MASMYLANGTRVTKAAFPTTAIPDPDLPKVVSADIYDTRRYSDTDTIPQGSLKRLLFKAGMILTQAQIDTLFPAATIVTVTPAGGAAAGGTAVTITGENLDGVSGITVGGVAATALVIVSDRVITLATGAHAAGAVDVVVTDDSGAVTEVGGFTYA